MSNQAPDAIVKWAEKKTLAGNKTKAKRLTQSEVGLLIQMHKEGKSQVEIAQLLGITQPAVHKWLQNLTDTTQPAKLYLRGSALRMAQNIVHRGAAKDHVVALKGLGVLEEQQQQGVTVLVGSGGVVNFGSSGPPQSLPDVVVVSEQHSIKAE